jgi:hypothetical protein
MAKQKNKNEADLKEEIDLLDTMLTSLVELLEQKGILTQEEWERKIEKNVKIAQVFFVLSVIMPYFFVSLEN